MTAPAPLVKALALHDPHLRCRWAKATRQWFIERRMPARHPDFLTESSRRLTLRDRHTLAFDRRESIQAGYFPLFTVPAEAIHQTERVMASLREWDAATQGSFRAINRRLDEAHVAWEAALRKERSEYTEVGSEDVYDRVMWAEGHKIATSMGEPAESLWTIEQKDGFLVRTRGGRQVA